MQTKLTASMAVLMLSLAAPQVRGESPTEPPRAQVQDEGLARPNAPKGATLASKAEDDHYAAREAKSPDAKQYRGGDVIVISATTVAVILLVVLVLLLI